MDELFEDIQHKITSISMLDLEIRNGDSYKTVLFKREKATELNLLLNMLPSTRHMTREY